MVNWLKLVLDNLVSLFQNAFIPRQSIRDNIIIAYELLSYVFNTPTLIGLRGSKAILKLEIQEAYDNL